MNDIKVKIFAIAKDEGAYIPQWVFHHFYFGFDEIEIWLNNIEDNSVEVCEKLANVYPKFKYKVADEFLRECLRENKMFQYEAYNFLFRDELKKNKFTHILFLDLDEFWIPKDFQSKIADFINQYPSADSISFPWYFDGVDYTKKIGDPLLMDVNKLYFDKDQHVKTLVKITNKVKGVNIHNHIIQNGIQIDSIGDVLPVTEPLSMHGSKIPKKFKDIEKDNIQYPAFIYHTILRSQYEYMASLLRGRRHAVGNNSPVLKVNRWGYLTNNGCFEYKIDSTLLQEYCKLLNNFCKLIITELNVSRDIIMSRYFKVIEELNKNDNFNRFGYLLKGVHLLEIDRISGKSKFHIDHLSYDNSQLIIRGWSVFYTYNDISKIIFYDQKQQLCLQGNLSIVDRPDVVRIVDNKAPLNCGFNFICQINDIKDTSKLKVSLDRFDKKTNTVIFNVEY